MHGWLEVEDRFRSDAEIIPVRVRIANHLDPILVRFGSILLICGHEREAVHRNQPNGFHEQALDAYEAQLDQQIEENNGVTLCVTAYEKDGTERWTACCLDAEEFQEAMIEVLRDGLQARADHDSRTDSVTDREPCPCQQNSA